MDVVRDLLDKAVSDRNGREMGRVDGIVLEQRAGEPPRLSAILIGASALGERLHPTLGRWAKAIESALGITKRPIRIEVADIEAIERKVKIALTIGDTGAGIVEQRVRAWLTSIPGSQ